MGSMMKNNKQKYPMDRPHTIDELIDEKIANMSHELDNIVLDKK